MKHAIHISPAVMLWFVSCGIIGVEGNPNVDILSDIASDADTIEVQGDAIPDTADLPDPGKCPDGMIAIDFPCDKEIKCISETQYKKYQTKTCEDLGYNPQCCTGATCSYMDTFSCPDGEICVQKEAWEDDECVKKTSCPSGKEGDLLFTFQADSGILSAPAIGDDGTAYFGTVNGTFYAVDCKGKEKWKWKKPGCNNSYAASPALGPDGTIYAGGNYIAVCSDLPAFYFLTPDGKQKWADPDSPLQFATFLSPAITGDGTAYIAGQNFGLSPGKLFSIDKEGKLNAGFPVELKSLTTEPAFSGNMVFIGHSAPIPGASAVSSTIVAVNAEGKLIWTSELATAEGTKYDSVGLSSIAIDRDGMVFAASYNECPSCLQPDSRLISLNPMTGAQVWSVQLPGNAKVIGSPVIGLAAWGQDVIVATQSGSLINANPQSGGAMITFDVNFTPFPFAGSPVLGDDGYIYAGTGTPLVGAMIEGQIYKLSKDGKDKKLIASTSSGDYLSSSLVMGNGGALYFGTPGGKLYAIQSGAKDLDKEAPWPVFRHDAGNTGNSAKQQTKE